MSLQNHLNLPTKITFGTTGTIDYLYDAAGIKLQKKVTQGTNITTTDYLGGYQYTNNVLDFFPTAEGYVKHTLVSGVSYFNYVFNYTDHLGNVRLSYTKDPATGVTKIIEENHNYPFGLKHNYNATDYEFSVSGSSVVLSQVTENTFNYQYNGKELQEEIGLQWYDYGARNYDAALGRFMSIDLKADDAIHVDLSPYVYSWNNPTNINDPDGNCPWCVGAIIGVLVDYGTQVAVNYAQGKSGTEAWTDVDGKSIAISGLSGAASGGLSTLKNTTQITKTGLQLAIDVTEESAHQLNETGSVSAGNLVKNVAMDKVADNFVGDVKILDNVPNSTKQYAKDKLDRAERLNTSGSKASRQDAVKEAKKLVKNNEVKDNAIDVTNGSVKKGLEKAAGNAIDNTVQTTLPILNLKKKNLKTPVIQARDNTNLPIKKDFRIK